MSLAESAAEVAGMPPSLAAEPDLMKPLIHNKKPVKRDSQWTACG
jgi:hypothetical protein